MFTRTVRPGLVILALLLSLVALGPAAGNSLWTEQAKLIASDGGIFDNFGYSAALSGNTALVGAPLHDRGIATDSGAAYVYRWDGSLWVQQAKLDANDPVLNDQYGFSVALHGNTVLIGSPLNNAGGITDAGAAYLYEWDGVQWVEGVKLTASDGEQFDNFGQSVAIHGDIAVVGAYHDDIGVNSDAGSAYIFRWDGLQWVEEAKLTDSNGVADDWFGYSVAVSGDTALVGAYGIGGGGAAFVWEWDGAQWLEKAKLTVADGGSLGWAVALRGGTALVGAPFAASLSGAAYVYRWDGIQWVEQAKLTASDGEAFEQFGHSVAISGKTALVGAHVDEIGGIADVGSAYAFRWDGIQWVEQAKLTASDGATLDKFGQSVAFSGRTALVGAYVDDIFGGDFTGSAYIFGWEP